jgi:ABC-type multidrug transport system ATPase subunit
LIKIEGVKKYFWYCCKKKVKVINNLFLGLQQNEKFGLLGFNGSGKSVSIKMIINEILYDTGKITLFQYNNRSQMNKINSKIGYCPEENLLFENMKVKEIIQFFIEIKNRGEIMNVENISEKFGLNNYLEYLYSNLSRGNKRKLFIAISLMNKADILLLDEPFIGLDVNSKRMTWNNIESLTNKKQKYNMILSSQSLDEADILCDRISWFKKGNFSFIGKSDILKENNNLKYKLVIKLDESKFNKEELLSTNKIEESFKLICDLVKNFNQYREYFSANPQFDHELEELYNIINQIKNDIKSIESNEVGKNNSYSFSLEIIKEQKTDLYCKIVELKNMNNKISEISIQKESLENILFFSK